MSDEYAVRDLQKSLETATRQRDRWRYVANQFAEAVKKAVMADEACANRAGLMECLDVWMEARLED